MNENIKNAINILSNDIEILEKKLEFFCNFDNESIKITRKILKLTKKLYIKNNTLVYLLNLLKND